MKRFMVHELVFCVAAVILSLASSDANAIMVWQSTFDSGPDGVVDIADNNFAKVMIGPVADGRLSITTMDNQTDAYTPDKAGRVLELNGSTPVPRTYNTSQSAQYKFQWTGVPTAVEGREAYHFAGFMGPTGPQTRQVMGTLMTHWNVGDDYYMKLGIAVMGVGFTDFGYNAGPVINLGPDPTNKDYEIRIEFDGTSHVMSVKMLDGTSTIIAANTRDLDIADTTNDADGVWRGWFAYGQNNFQNETNSISVTHLGWEDYTGWLEGDKSWNWSVDSLAYWDESAVPLPFTQPSSADYNHDGIVDAADYTVWRKNLGTTGAPGSVPGDGTSSDLLGVPNGVVDQFDYAFWKSRYGSASGSGAGSGLDSPEVPEPSSMLFVASAVSLLIVAAQRECRCRS